MGFVIKKSTVQTQTFYLLKESELLHSILRCSEVCDLSSLVRKICHLVRIVTKVTFQI